MSTASDKRDSAPGWTGATTDPTRLVLLRHGQSPMSIRREYSGSRSNPDLTEFGRRQANAAARHLRDLADAEQVNFAAIVTSPQRRAQQTAEAAAEALGLDIVVDEDLRETDFGNWEGLTFSEAHTATPQLHSAWLADPSVAPPEGEDFHTVDRRVAAARGRIADQFGASDVLVVSHVTPIKALLRQGLGCGFEIFTRLHLDLASLSIVEFYADGPTSVRLVNDTSYLRG
ncbi:MAG: histidine phosphatase family protein [Corynebacterium sp.]|nr:histidine phosphatase family protein [Corynebacterium sp.]MDO5029719.1 histidine phosphatase family protein [Corynebacterium sp.]